MGKSNPRTKVPLKPRWQAWRRVWAGLIPLLLALGICPFGWAKDLVPFLLGVIVNCLVFLSVYVPEIVAEYRRRPAVMRYWEDGSPPGVTVRNQRSEEVLLHSDIASFADQDLSEVPLRSANLQGLDLKRVDLGSGDLCGADLRGALLTDADLSNANLRGANMSGTGLRGTNLSGADLRDVRFGFCVMAGTDFRAADLRGADFVGGGSTMVVWSRDLQGADFRGALYDRTTRWPLGFNPQSHGCIFAPKSSHELPIPSEVEATATDSLPLAVEVAPVEALQPSPITAADPEQLNIRA